MTPIRSNTRTSADTSNDPGRRRKVLAIIPRGEVIRNFVYSGAFDLLGRDVELSLLSVVPSDSVLEMLRTKFGRVETLSNSPEPWIVRIQREILETAHNRWLWTGAARERSRLRDAEARTLEEKAKRTLKKAISFPIANRIGLNSLARVERFSSRRFRSANEYTKLLKEIRPDLVFNGSHVHSANAHQAVQAAQWLGIPTATFIFSWDNLTSQGRILLPYDHYLVWNEGLRDQLIGMYPDITPDAVHVTGTPQFDFHFREEFHQTREEFCHSIGADPKRPIVLYSTGMANHMPGEPEIVEEIADMLGTIDTPAQPQLVVRVYPKDRTGRFDRLMTVRRDILFPKIEWEDSWHTPRYEDSYALVNALRHAAVGINVASTISLELCMFDKPVINVGYNPPSIDPKELQYAAYYDFDHYRPIVESGAVHVAYSPREMAEMLRAALSNPSAHSRERKHLIDRMFANTLDGRSADRTADVLRRIAHKQL